MNIEYNYIVTTDCIHSMISFIPYLSYNMDKQKIIIIFGPRYYILFKTNSSF